MDENSKDDGSKPEFGLRDSDFSNSKKDENEHVIEAEVVSSHETEKHKNDSCVWKKGFLTLPVRDILANFISNSISLLKDSEWIAKCASGYTLITVIISYFSNRFNRITGVASPSYTTEQMVVAIVYAILILFATAGLANIIYRKVLFNENVPMFAFDKCAVKILKNTVSIILIAILVLFLSAVVISFLLYPFMGVIGVLPVAPLLSTTFAFYVCVRMVLVLPSVAAGENLGIRKIYGCTGGYASSLVAIAAIYFIAFALLSAVLLYGVSFIKVPSFLYVGHAFLSAISQFFTMVLSVTVYKFFKKNNLLG